MEKKVPEKSPSGSEIRDDSQRKRERERSERSIPSDRLFIGSVNSRCQDVAPPPSPISLFDCNSALRPTARSSTSQAKISASIRVAALPLSLSTLSVHPTIPYTQCAHPTHTRHGAHVQRCRCTRIDPQHTRALRS